MVRQDDVEDRIIAETLKYIDKITSFVSRSRGGQMPSLVYIAVDGLPPRAKMSQQRKRRFMSEWRNRMLMLGPKNALVGDSGLKWDSSAITPGTSFMRRLNAALHDRFDGQLGYIVSDSDEIGEGETKIFRHVRARDEKKKEEEEVIVYGLDADLIMLSLVALISGKSISNILLLREPVEFKGGCQNKDDSHDEFLFFDVCALKRHLPPDIGIEDYVALCFLLGNDFIPSLSFLKINDNGIDYLLQQYARIQRQYPGSKLVRVDDETEGFSNCRLCAVTLLKLLTSVREDEDEMMAKADKSYYAQRVPLHPPELTEDVLDNWPVYHRFPDVIRPGAKSGSGWRERWYYHLFMGMTEASDVAKVCRNYLQGIQWTFEYYFRGQAPSQNWYYMYGGYSPTALDLCNVLATQKTATSRFEDACRPIEWWMTTDLQLLMVLPPDSAVKLLQTEAARRVVTDPEIGLTYMYPSQFHMHTYLKKYMWECTPILPPIDAEALYSALQRSSE